jgi:F-type H+-transporting ATPase subunit alpha
MDVIDEVLSIYAGTRGHLDKLPREEVAKWEREFLTFMHDQKQEIVTKLRDTKKLELDKKTNTNADLEAAITQFQKQYASQHAPKK